MSQTWVQSLLVADRLARWSVRRAVDRALRQHFPDAVLLLVDALVPDREPGAIRVAASQRRRITAERDGDVAVHLGLLRVVVPLEILVILDAIGERRLRVDKARAAAARPRIAVPHQEVVRRVLIEERLVGARHRG